MSRGGRHQAFHAVLYVYSIQIFTLRTVDMLDECSNVHSMQFNEANSVYAIQTEWHWPRQYCDLIEPHEILVYMT